jgi:hypothetical protein
MIWSTLIYFTHPLLDINQVVGNVLALDEQSQQHLLRHEELRDVRGDHGKVWCGAKM